MKLIRADYFMIVAFLMFSIAHGTTNYMINSLSDVAGSLGVNQEVVLSFEANPVARWAFGIENFRLIYSAVIMPGLLFGVYYFARKKHGMDQPFLLESLAFSIMIMGFMNALNDVSLLLGYLN